MTPMKPLAAALVRPWLRSRVPRARPRASRTGHGAPSPRDSTVPTGRARRVRKRPSRRVASCVYRGGGRPLRRREGHRGGARDGNPPRLRGLHDPDARRRARPRAVRRGDRRDRAPREAHDDLGPGERGLARQRGGGQGGRSPSGPETFDVIREALHASAISDGTLRHHVRDAARALEVRPGSRPTSADPGGRAGPGPVRRVQAREDRSRGEHGLSRRAPRPHRPRGHRQGLRGRPRVEGAPRRGAGVASTRRRAAISTPTGPSPTVRRGWPESAIRAARRTTTSRRWP